MSRVAVRVRPLAGQSCSSDVSGASSPSARQDLDSRRRRAEARNFQQVSLLLRAILVLPRDRPTDLYPRPSSPPQALVMGWVPIIFLMVPTNLFLIVIAIGLGRHTQSRK